MWLPSSMNTYIQSIKNNTKYKIIVTAIVHGNKYIKKEAIEKELS